MPFGISRILEAVHHLDKKLQQRLDDLVTATDRVRQDTDTAITTGLAGIHRDNDGLRGQVDQIRRELAALHALVDSRQAQPVAPTPGPDQAAVGGGDANSADHGALLGMAAGVARAGIMCHRDTWAFLVELAARREHFRLPAAVKENKHGGIEAALSGRALIAVLEALWEIRRAVGGPAGTRHLAEQVYVRIEAALQEVERVTSRDVGAPRPVARIVIDDRPTAAG